MNNIAINQEAIYAQQFKDFIDKLGVQSFNLQNAKDEAEEEIIILKIREILPKLQSLREFVIENSTNELFVSVAHELRHYIYSLDGFTEMLLMEDMYYLYEKDKKEDKRIVSAVIDYLKQVWLLYIFPLQ
jgi:signal transduction histidine kinase